VLWLVLNRLLFRPYMNALEERERRTAGASVDSSTLEQEGARLKVEYEEKIAQARATGTTAKDAIVQEGRQERERLLQASREEAARTLERARSEIQNQLRRERDALDAQIAGIAREMVGKVLGRSVG
jgi:F-type H+-transporting ATPase subunit b